MALNGVTRYIMPFTRLTRECTDCLRELLIYRTDRVEVVR